MRTFVYIDGFNLYHNCYRGLRNIDRQHLKWLDLRAFAERSVPDDQILDVNYYTAMIGNAGDDPGRNNRQLAFVLALQAHANVQVHLGHLQKSKREGRLVRPPAGVDPWQMVEVRQEKRSDVSLTTHLLHDAFRDHYDLALLVTNDSDYAEPIRVVTRELGKSVGVLSPDINVSKHLARHATFAHLLDLRLFGSCQLPDEIERPGQNPLRRPNLWRQPEQVQPD